MYCQRLSNVDEKHLNNLQPLCILGNVVISLIKRFTTILVASIDIFDEQYQYFNNNSKAILLFCF